jgi:transcriptional regulator with XRE-family HTH domain
MARRENMIQADIDAAIRLKALWNAKKKELDLTQVKVAEDFNITQGLVAHYLNGNQGLNLKAVMMFATVLGVDPKEIYPELFSKFHPTNPDEEFMSLYAQCPASFRALLLGIMRHYVDAQVVKEKSEETSE